MWVKLDPKRAINHKLLTAGIAASGFDVIAMCWSALHENDGFISEEDVRMLAGMYRSSDVDELVEALVRVGRWTKDGRKKGYQIKDFLEYNFSKTDMDARRRKDRDRKRKRLGLDTDSERNPGGTREEA